MEHIIQFGISIEDERIAKRVEEKAEAQITKAIQEKVEDILFEINPYGRRRHEGISEWTKDRFNEFLEANKGEIIGEAAKLLTDRLMRTKAVKDMVEGALK